jgi:hypothetical protein
MGTSWGAGQLALDFIRVLIWPGNAGTCAIESDVKSAIKQHLIATAITVLQRIFAIARSVIEALAVIVLRTIQQS